MYRFYFLTHLLCLTVALTGCDSTPSPSNPEVLQSAPGAPGQASTWAFAAKQGIGTSYEAYDGGKHSDTAETSVVSKVWFSIAKGMLTETMFGLIHEAQLKDLQFIVVGDDFVDIESESTVSTIDYLHKDNKNRPLSLAYKITNTDRENRYIIEKIIFTHPDTQALFHRVVFTPKQRGLRLFMQANPHMANTGEGDSAWVKDSVLYAREGNHVMGLSANGAFIRPTVGFLGHSDLITDLQDGTQHWQYLSSGDKSGNVTLASELNLSSTMPTTIDLVLAFGESEEQTLQHTIAAQKDGFKNSLERFNGEGDYYGWEDYLQSLPGLQALYPSATDGGKLANVSALVLKAQEDKSHSGALIASLSNPWGDTVSATEASTGYKAVWPRDFYQCAMAFLALGDTQTPLVAFQYLAKVQVSKTTPGNAGTSGWFLQKTHVDGTLEWVAVQLDQTAMPLMLAWKLWQQGIIDDDELTHWYTSMLRPAADFLVNGGTVHVEWNNSNITPPYTQQERWEEQEGYSPSSIAATIAGLVSAAEIARYLKDTDKSEAYLAAADQYERMLESTTYTTSGVYPTATDRGQYYLRISANTDPNDNGKLLARNGRPAVAEKAIIDAGFLELVRYGIRTAHDIHITNSLSVVDDQNIDHDYRIKYEFASGDKIFPGWRRYGMDGYGEDQDNGNAYAQGGDHSPNQRGRVWPFFTGERGHYALAAGVPTENIKDTYVAAMEFFANEGLMLPEQVWDGVGANTPHKFKKGDGTNSATPLAWTHAEYIKLLRSISDEAVWDRYPPVEKRYRP